MRCLDRAVRALLLLGGISFGAAVAPAEAWEITRFDADLRVGPDARLHVVETLHVNFGPERRHAICRSLPRFARDPSGERRPLGLDLIAVTDAAGRPWPVRVEGTSRSFDVWMGSDERFTTGEQIYRLTYEVAGAVWPGPYRDELHWDVTGNAWDVLVITGAARVTWPPGADAEQIEGASRVTRFGRVMREADVKVIDAHHAQFLLNRGLMTGEGLSISVVWSHGLVRHPGWVDRALYSLRTNPAFLLVPVAAAFLLLLGAQRRRLRSAPAESLRASRPELSAVEAGVLSRGHLEPAHVAAALVDLDRRGALHVSRGAESGAEIRCAAAVPPPADLTPLEARLCALLVPAGAPATLPALAGRAVEAWPVLAREVEAALIARGDLDPRVLSRRSPVLLGALVALVLGVVAGVAGRRASHGLIGMATVADWLAVGGASLLLASTVVALGALVPRTTGAGGRRRAALARYRSELAAAGAPIGEGGMPFAIALGMPAPAVGRAEEPVRVAARALEHALEHARGRGRES
jgi:hypothetical protein